MHFLGCPATDVESIRRRIFGIVDPPDMDLHRHISLNYLLARMVLTGTGKDLRSLRDSSRLVSPDWGRQGQSLVVRTIRFPRTRRTGTM